MFKPFSYKFLLTALSVWALSASSSIYAENSQPPQAPPNNGGQSTQHKGRGREEIALNDNNNQLINQTLHRGDWDYRENWQYNRDAYLSGMNQSQFDTHLRPYGYGPYNYGSASYQNNSNSQYPDNRSYSQYGYRNYSNNYPRTYNNEAYYGYHPTYGMNQWNYSQYPQHNYSISSYPDYAMYYPQQGINTGYGANNYADRVYYRYGYHGSADPNAGVVTTATTAPNIDLSNYRNNYYGAPYNYPNMGFNNMSGAYGVNPYYQNYRNNYYGAPYNYPNMGFNNMNGAYGVNPYYGAYGNTYNNPYYRAGVPTYNTPSVLNYNNPAYPYSSANQLGNIYPSYNPQLNSGYYNSYGAPGINNLPFAPNSISY